MHYFDSKWSTKKMHFKKLGGKKKKKKKTLHFLHQGSLFTSPIRFYIKYSKMNNKNRIVPILQLNFIVFVIIQFFKVTGNSSFPMYF